MKKRTVTRVLAAVAAMSLLLVGCGGAADSGSSSGSKDAGEAGGSIRLLNNKAEIDTGLVKLAEAYEAETGVKVEIETIGGGVDTQATLKNYYQADNMPDIFVFEGDTHYVNWEGKLEDLSDEAWVEDTDAEYINGGKVYGFPITTEAIGLTYNASILEKAGIDPKSITGPESMRAAFEKLDSMKDELGLTAVIGYYTEAANLWWTAGQHLFGTYFDVGLARDDSSYMDKFNVKGELDMERAKPWAEMVALFNEYTDPKGVSGTYDDQVAGFASGKYAFVTQGSWIGATMIGQDKDMYDAAGNFEVGMIPYAFIEGQDTIQTASPNWWGVYNEGNVDTAKAFLQWVSEDDGGQQIMAEDCGCITPYKSSTHQANDPFAATIAEYVGAGKTSAWHWQSWKEGIGQNATAVVFQDFAKGSIKDVDTFLDTLQRVCEDYYAQ